MSHPNTVTCTVCGNQSPLLYVGLGVTASQLKSGEKIKTAAIQVTQNCRICGVDLVTQFNNVALHSCRTCGQSVTASSEFCPRCGTKAEQLLPALESCAVCGGLHPKHTVRCLGNGEPIEPVAREKLIDKTLEDESTTWEASPETRWINRAMLVIQVLGVLAGICIVLGIIGLIAPHITINEYERVVNKDGLSTTTSKVIATVKLRKDVADFCKTTAGICLIGGGGIGMLSLFMYLTMGGAFDNRKAFRWSYAEHMARKPDRKKVEASLVEQGRISKE